MINSITGRHVASISAPFFGSDPVSGHRYVGWKPCIEWCEHQWGNYNNRWFFIGEGVFEFNDERDYLMFMLRWGS
jgi:hypothetical protein